MRERESKYWDATASAILKERSGNIRDNVWKRSMIVSNILRHRPYGLDILEIGVGFGLAAATVNLVTLGMNHFTVTDVSPVFCDYVKDRWKINSVNTDILNLPDGKFDMIWCFDSLEHVRPEERLEGYKQISDRLKGPGLIMINAPSMNNSNGHDQEFDHHYDGSDILALNDVCGTEILKWEPYTIPEIGDLSYTWVELYRK